MESRKRHALPGQPNLRDRITFVIRLTLRIKPDDCGNTEEEIIGQVRCIENGASTTINGFRSLKALITENLIWARANSEDEINDR